MGLALIALVLGIVLGRSSRFMSRMGEMHAAAHGGTATGGQATAHQSVSTVVVVDRDGVPLTGGRYDLDALAVSGHAGTVDSIEPAAVVGELVEGGEDAIRLDADEYAARWAYVTANEDPR